MGSKKRKTIVVEAEELDRFLLATHDIAKALSREGHSGTVIKKFLVTKMLNVILYNAIESNLRRRSVQDGESDPYKQTNPH